MPHPSFAAELGKDNTPVPITSPSNKNTDANRVFLADPIRSDDAVAMPSSTSKLLSRVFFVVDVFSLGVTSCAIFIFNGLMIYLRLNLTNIILYFCLRFICELLYYLSVFLQ
jgi:hypothetical protein